MEWIDAHVHIGEDEGGVEASLADVQQLFDEGHIDRAVVFCLDEVDGIPAGNDRVRAAVAEDDRLVGLFRLDPAVHDPEDVLAADWAAGVKLHPRSQDFGMQAVHDHLDALAGTGTPVLVHTGGWSRRAHPEEVLEAAEIHGDVPFVLAHTLKGYYFHAPDGFKERLQQQENAYLDLSLLVTPLGIEVLVEDLGADRLLFASDYPYDHPLPQRQRVELADISDAAAERIAGGNAERLFF
ncbi:MAG: amidohydrolase family protein [Candidatus Nanohaloarchaea archaeon]|nr:amidohydrolase family protein [Candidatus Nanohaloarchaea archaeon]